jgi:hypothetical protein
MNCVDLVDSEQKMNCLGLPCTSSLPVRKTPGHYDSTGEVFLDPVAFGDKSAKIRELDPTMSD